MKILYLCSDLGIPVLGRKGASIHVRSLVTALNRAGHTVRLAASLLTKSPWEEPARLDVPVEHLPLGPAARAAVGALKAFNEAITVTSSLPGEVRRILHNVELLKKLKEHFKDDPPDVIYERASILATAGVGLAQALDRPLMLELNAPLSLEQMTYRSACLGDLVAQVERWTLSHADIVLAVSAPLAEYVVSLGVEPDRVQVITNAVDPLIFSPGTPDLEMRSRWGLGVGPVLGFVGGLRPWHGVEVLPALLERLERRYPDARLVIAGEGSLRGELERDVRERELERKAVFTGALPHEEVAALIRQFDIALAPYPQPEHAFYFSPLKLFEYMACGTAVVAARLGQIAEVVHHGETGLLYPPGDLDALSAACERLLANPDLRRRLGQAAAREIHTHYTWERNATRVAELAESLKAAREARQ